MSEETKKVELNEVENTTTENVELTEQTEGQTATEEQTEEEIKPLPEQKPFILSRQERVILDEMERRAEENPAIAAGLKDKGKSIQECYAFITHRAKKMAEGNSAMIEDEVVYDWAAFYYTQRREIIDLEYKSTPKPTATTATTASKGTNKAKGEKKDTKPTATKVAPAKPEETAGKGEESEELTLF